MAESEAINKAAEAGEGRPSEETNGAPDAFELGSGAWEAFWVIAFYASVVIVLLATFRVIPWYASLAGIAAVFLSILAIASSSRRLLVEEGGLVLEATRFWLSRRRPLPLEEVRGLQVVESRRSSQWEGEEPPQRDLSYFVFVDLLTAGGKVRAFRSSLTAPPGSNRAAAMRVAEKLSRITGQRAERLLH